MQATSVTVGGTVLVEGSYSYRDAIDIHTSSALLIEKQSIGVEDAMVGADLRIDTPSPIPIAGRFGGSQSLSNFEKGKCADCSSSTPKRISFSYAKGTDRSQGLCNLALHGPPGISFRFDRYVATLNKTQIVRRVRVSDYISCCNAQRTTRRSNYAVRTMVAKDLKARDA
jgi:hypothetical protein